MSEKAGQARNDDSARERAAFEALMRRHNRLLYRTARSIVRNDADAEDCVQEAFIKAWRHRGDFRGESAPATWLTRIAINEALQRLRQRKGDGRDVDFDNVVEIEMHVDPSQPAPQRFTDPGDATLRHELCTLLERRIDALPASFRTVFMLRAIEEMSVEDTATCLGIPEATVRTRLFRARGMLRESIASDVDLAMASAFEFLGERCDRIVANVLARIPDVG